MNVPLEDNFQFSYQRLRSFLGRRDEQGYMFCRADDLRFAKKINEDLVQDLLADGINAKTIFLTNSADAPLLHQVETAVAGTQALIVANLFEIVNDSAIGFSNLTQLNFAREAFWQLNKPILFWADERSMNAIANHAPDLYSQRRHTTVHFTGTIDRPVATRLPKQGWEQFLSSEEFNDLETNIDMLEKRLRGARESGYPANRTFSEIALPLARDYATLRLVNEAEELLESFDAEIKHCEDEEVLARLAEVFYKSHRYNEAIGCLRKANAQIEHKQRTNGTYGEYPKTWYVNLAQIALWFAETGNSPIILEELQTAHAQLEKCAEHRPVPWKFRHLSVIDNLIGNILHDAGNLAEAKYYYERGLKAVEELGRKNPDSWQIQRDVSVFLDKMGNTLQGLGRLAEAKEYYERGLKIREQLSGKNPQSEKLQRDLSISLENIGNALRDFGNLTGAKEYYERGLEIAEQLSSNNPHSEQLQRDLGSSYFKLARLLQDEKESKAALKYFGRALGVFQQLSEANPFSQRRKDDVGTTEASIAILKAQNGASHSV